MSGLESLNLVDFRRGLNLRVGEFQLLDGESPGMVNVELDPVSGFYVRPGWVRWNAADVETPATWDPRHAHVSPLSSGAAQVYVASNADVFAAGADGVFSALSIPCSATPHLADFATWGDATYIATGTASTPTKRVGTSAPTTLADASLGWNADYTTPAGGRMPLAELVEAHAGYLFVANVVENGSDPGAHPNRIRWSHPDEPEDWAQNDYIDIDSHGGRITALQSFQDHLLIFKEESVWALYGYELESWQLVQVSESVGAPTMTAVTRNEGSVFFFSAAAGTGVFRYDGQGVAEISQQLTPALDGITNLDDIWLGWIDRRLWVATSWTPEGDLTPTRTGAFIWNPSLVEGGAWIYHRPAVGRICSIVEHSETRGQEPLIVLADAGTDEVSCLVRVPRHRNKVYTAQDEIVAPGTLTSYNNYYTTRWLHADWPDRLKSWLRARFVARLQPLPVQLRLDVYKDYNTAAPVRSTEGYVAAGSNAVLFRELGYDDPAGGGFDFKELGAADPSGRGADWGVAASGSGLGRTGSGFGPARAVQVRVSNATGDIDAGRPWAIDAMMLKYRYRRFTT